MSLSSHSGLPLEDVRRFLRPAVVGSAEVYGYRSKITPHVAEHRNGEIAIGFKGNNNKTVVDVEVCPIATPNINARYMEVPMIAIASAIVIAMI